MYKHKLADIVRDNTVSFVFFQEGVMYYEVFVDDVRYEFPVPINDVGTGVLYPKDKAILFMRWIRKGLESESMRMEKIADGA